MKKYQEMTYDEAKAAIDKCIRDNLQGAVKDEDIRRPLQVLGVPKEEIALKILPTPIFGRLSDGEFNIEVTALAPNGDIIRFEIHSGKRPTT